MELVQAINNLEADHLISILGKESDSQLEASSNLFHNLIWSLDEKSKQQEDGIRLVYILSNYGIDINKQDEAGNTPLYNYLSKAEFCHPDVVEAFLRCNADVVIKNNDGKSIVSRLRQGKLPKDIADICLKYVPGLWIAVETDDISTVRTLVNQWCKVDIYKEGKSLLQLALEKGTEDVIRIISGIKTSLSVVHGVLAGDIKYVKRLTEGREKVNVNLKNMGDRNATPLYYAACQNNTEMINLLVTCGARTDLSMTFRECDIPAYFALMMEYPLVTVETLKLLLPFKPVPVDKMFFKGRNILFYCVDSNMHIDIVEEILLQSSAYIVTQRVQDNMTARDYAVAENCDKIVQVIDKHVRSWFVEDKFSSQRQMLFLHGYTDLPMIDKDQMEDSKDLLTDHDINCLDQIEKFHEAVEMCEADKVKELLYCGNFGLTPLCLADSRTQGYGQPALHKSVLRKDIETCKIIAEALVYQCNQKLDSVRDQFFRTALHYACGMLDGKEFMELLMDYGSSDFAMDKDGRSPLAFKDRQELTEMQDLLQYQLLQDLSDPEPDPWSVPLPMPVVGYLIDCAHSQHKHLSRHMAEKLAVELNPIGHSQKHNIHHTHQSNGMLMPHLLNSTNHRQLRANDSHSGDATYDPDYENDSDDISEDEDRSNPSSSCCIL